MNDDLKAQFCKALGVTVEEVDELDRAMHGPETRAQRAKDEADFLAYVDAVGQVLADEFTAALPEGMSARWETTDE